MKITTLSLLLLSSVTSGEVYKVTAYSHGCIMPDGKKDKPNAMPRRAANGSWPIAHVTIAADWRLHKPGSEVIVEGLGYRTVTDKGKKIKGKRIDLFMSNCKDAKKFGVKHLRVWKVPNGTTNYSSKRQTY